LPAARPLDSAFNEDTPGRSNNRRLSFRSIFLLSLFSLSSISAVYAASVSINGGSDISYSQGVEVIAPCDPDGIGVDLDFNFNTTNNIWVLGNYRQSLTGIHSDCFSISSGVKRTLKVNFYEGTTLQLSVTGSMPLKSYNGFSVDTNTNNNTIYFAGAGSNQAVNEKTPLDGSNAGCSSNAYSAAWLCGVDFSTSSPTTSGSTRTQASKSYKTGCATVANQPAGFTNLCRAWNIAANSDRIVVEIE
jgi:hypothetical protein